MTESNGDFGIATIKAADSIDEEQSKEENGNQSMPLGVSNSASGREIMAWYLYDWANSVYYSVALSGLLPLQILRLAELHWCKIQGINRPECNSDDTEGFDDARVPFIGLSVRPDSVTTYFISFSVLVQAFVFVTVAPLADFGSLRYILLVLFGVFGALSTCTLFFISNPNVWYVAGIVLIISNTCIGASIIFYNAFLPILVDNHPEVVQAKNENSDPEESASNDRETTFGNGAKDETSAFNSLEVGNQNFKRSDKVSEVKDLVGSRLSSRGLIAGYVSGTLLIVICAIIGLTGVLTPSESDQSYGKDTLVYRFSNGISGIWWLTFGILSYLGLKVRPSGIKLPKQFWRVATLGIRSTADTLTTSFRTLPNAFYMLAAWFFYSDGVNTLTSVASIFASKELNMTGTELSLILAETPLFAVLGTYLFQKLYEIRIRDSEIDMQDKTIILNKRAGTRLRNFFACYGRKDRKVTHRTMIELTLYLFVPLPVYTLLGFIPGVPFMKSKVEIYVFAAWFGSLLGAIQSFSRSLFMDLVPKSQEARFFSLYEITDKGSSWIGPLLVGLIANLGSMRYGMIVVLCSIVIGFFFLQKVDVEIGRQQALNFGTSKIEEDGASSVKSKSAGAQCIEIV